MPKYMQRREPWSEIDESRKSEIRPKPKNARKVRKTVRKFFATVRNSHPSMFETRACFERCKLSPARQTLTPGLIPNRRRRRCCLRGVFTDSLVNRRVEARWGAPGLLSRQILREQVNAAEVAKWAAEEVDRRGSAYLWVVCRFVAGGRERQSHAGSNLPCPANAFARVKRERKRGLEAVIGDWRREKRRRGGG